MKIFVQKISASYPGYAIADTIISIAGKNKDGCQQALKDNMIGFTSNTNHF